LNQITPGQKLPTDDLNEIIGYSSNNLENLRDANVLLSGGTGFVGKWLVCALQRANQELSLNLSVTILTRNVIEATRIFSHIESRNINFVQVDLSNSNHLEFKSTFEFSHIIHAGVMVAKPVNDIEEKYINNSSFNGAKLLLEIAKRQVNVPNFIHLSSGAVYNRGNLVEGKFQEVAIQKTSEELSSYGRAKLEAELLINQYGEKGIIRQSNPRLFAFFGPGLPLDKQFAIGNFLNDALKHTEIGVNGNPKTIRSYMYPVDLIVWLLAVIASPISHAINIGSPDPVTIGELSQLIGRIGGNKKVTFTNPNQEPTVYVPSVNNMTSIYSVKTTVGLEAGLERWMRWLTSDR
jgi:UDP-glucuronate decarboxylase